MYQNSYTECSHWQPCSGTYFNQYWKGAWNNSNFLVVDNNTVQSDTEKILDVHNDRDPSSRQNIERLIK